MNARVIPAIGINLARRCKPVLLAQLYYAERVFCCDRSLSSIFGLKIAKNVANFFLPNVAQLTLLASSAGKQNDKICYKLNSSIFVPIFTGISRNLVESIKNNQILRRSVQIIYL